MKKLFIVAVLGSIVISIISGKNYLFAQEKTSKQAVIEGNNAFALDLYAKLSNEEGNLFFSPSSISTARHIV